MFETRYPIIQLPEFVWVSFAIDTRVLLVHLCCRSCGASRDAGTNKRVVRCRTTSDRRSSFDRLTLRGESHDSRRTSKQEQVSASAHQPERRPFALTLVRPVRPPAARRTTRRFHRQAWFP